VIFDNYMGATTMSEDILKGVDRDALRKWLKESDGYSIMDPNFFIKMGFSPEFLEPYSRAHKSGEGKYAITDHNGKLLRHCFGVYELDFAWLLGRRLQCDNGAGMFHGRGRQFRWLVAAILKHLDQ
jgi:hypothetical protein